MSMYCSLVSSCRLACKKMSYTTVLSYSTLNHYHFLALKLVCSNVLSAILYPIMFGRVDRAHAKIHQVPATTMTHDSESWTKCVQCGHFPATPKLAFVETASHRRHYHTHMIRFNKP
jgi:hypothetical protein